ncbi:MAG: hypothetical protein JJU36_16155 [Phycisphaeraceae bacterium]|nr:hypothetical protein [Phycisphaeraceae bacterium]
MTRPDTLTARILPLIVLLACVAARPMPASGNMSPVWLGTPFMEGWVPENADAVRGVLILNGFPMGEPWLEACAMWNFAVLRINTDAYSSRMPDSPEYAPLRRPHAALKSVVMEGLAQLAERTGHPEIEYVPLVASGYSRYSPSAPRIMSLFPDRALAFMNGGGGFDDFTRNQVPSLVMLCEWENIFSGGDKTQLLSSWWSRASNQLAMVSIHWRVYHNPNSYPDLGIIFLNEVIEARIPGDWDPRTGPCQLKPLDHDSGWLGSHEGWRTPVDQLFEVDNNNAHIAPVADFQGDPRRASWLVSEKMAWAWRAFSSRFPVARFIEPGTPSTGRYSSPTPPPTGYCEMGIRAGIPFEFTVLSHVRGVKKIELFINTHHVGTIDQFVGGETALGSTRDAMATMTVTVDEPGIHILSGRFHTEDGSSGWMRHIPLMVWSDRVPGSAPASEANKPDHADDPSPGHAASAVRSASIGLLLLGMGALALAGRSLRFGS